MISPPPLPWLLSLDAWKPRLVFVDCQWLGPPLESRIVPSPLGPACMSMPSEHALGGRPVTRRGPEACLPQGAWGRDCIPAPQAACTPFSPPPQAAVAGGHCSAIRSAARVAAHRPRSVPASKRMPSWDAVGGSLVSRKGPGGGIASPPPTSPAPLFPPPPQAAVGGEMRLCGFDPPRECCVDARICVWKEPGQHIGSYPWGCAPDRRVG